MSKKISVLFAMIGALIVVALTLLIVGILQRESAIDSLDSERSELEQQGYQMELTIEALSSAKASLEAQIASLKSEISSLEEKLKDASSLQADAEAALLAQIKEKTDSIAALEADIEKYKTVFNINVREQAQLIENIDAYIATMCPYVRMVDTYDEKTKETTYKLVAVTELMAEELQKATEAEEEFILSEDELKEIAEDQEALASYQKMIDETMRARVLAREDVFLPNVSVYYEDLATGYSYGYEENKVYDSASVIKAPWVLSLLQAVAADEQKFYDGLFLTEELPPKVDTDGDGEPDSFQITYSDPLFDLSEKVIYDKETMYKEGSGDIKDMEDGTEFTWLDFVKYTLEKSDNVAYQAMRERYGFDLMTALARRTGANSVLKNGRNMTAADAGKLFKAIYNFIETDEKYGQIMKESMRKSRHTVIIPYGVYPNAAVHKYGWDVNAYHDAAIVMYGDKPFILTVFSDLDNGGAEVNAFLSDIVRMVFKLHKGFYS